MAFYIICQFFTIIFIFFIFPQLSCTLFSNFQQFHARSDFLFAKDHANSSTESIYNYNGRLRQSRPQNQLVLFLFLFQRVESKFVAFVQDQVGIVPR